jgi:hypothetical protein
MANDEWYANPNWEEKDRKEFFEELSKKKSKRDYYITAKAGYMTWRHKPPLLDEAIELIKSEISEESPNWQRAFFLLTQIESLKKYGNMEYEIDSTLANDDMAQLAENLVVYLHMDIKEIFSYSLDSLTALDNYFLKHSQKIEYKEEYLRRTFIPVLGAYLGEVIVRNLKGSWIIRKNILKSAVLLNGSEVAVFESAVKVVYESLKLSELYRSLIS